MILEAVKLGVVAIAARFSTQDCLREERFPPQRYQALGIKILRM